MGFANKKQIFELTDRLVNHLARKTFLYTGEGETIIGVLEDIGNYAIQKKDVSQTDISYLRAWLAFGGEIFIIKYSIAISDFLFLVSECIKIFFVVAGFRSLTNPMTSL